MKVLFIGDDSFVSDVALERIFAEAVFPHREMIQEIGILNASQAELYAIKWAKKLHIPYLGFLYNIEAARAYADLVIHIGSEADRFMDFFEGKIFLHYPVKAAA